jgi:hypothetical protein
MNPHSFGYYYSFLVLVLQVLILSKTFLPPPLRTVYEIISSEKILLTFRTRICHGYPISFMKVLSFQASVGSSVLPGGTSI